jgi:hypothetical protein
LRNALLLALACIAGLLTKAFFVPITLAAMAYAAVVVSRRVGWPKATLRMAVLSAIIALGSGWWFALYAARYGTPLGSHETWMAAQRASFAGDALTPLAFALALLRSVAAFLATFLWCGTWSWVRRPDWHYLLMLPLAIACLWGAWRGWRNAATGLRLPVLALALLVPVLCGLASHIVLRVRVNGIGDGTPGYYLFVAWPLVGVLLSGVWNCLSSRHGRWLVASALLSATVMEGSGLWFCAQVYAGIIEKTGPTTFGMGAALPTPANIGLVIQRLDLLCFPRVSLACLLPALLIKLGLWHAFALAVLRECYSTRTSQTRAWSRPLVAVTTTRSPENVCPSNS